MEWLTADHRLTKEGRCVAVDAALTTWSRFTIFLLCTDVLWPRVALRLIADCEDFAERREMLGEVFRVDERPLFLFADLLVFRFSEVDPSRLFCVIFRST